MRILFLDVDGVLNCAFTKEKIDGCLFVMDSKIELLKEIVDRTGVKIVLSSTWRQGWYDLEHGINSRDVKHFIALRDKLAEYGLKFLSRTPVHTTDERGAEIAEWLENWRVPYDEETTKWFQRHPDEAITILRCEQCGLFYNPGIGHKCEVVDK